MAKIAPTFHQVFYKSYSRRKDDGKRETLSRVLSRVHGWLVSKGELTLQESIEVWRLMESLQFLPAGRQLWVAGTKWLNKPENYAGIFNCTSFPVIDWDSFGLLMNLAMMGCGTGANLEDKYISQLPTIRNKLHVNIISTPGGCLPIFRTEETIIDHDYSKGIVEIEVGDSRQGWVKAYQTLLELSSNDNYKGSIIVNVDVSMVRASGEKLQGFGGTANPVALPGLFPAVAEVLNRATGRKLNSVELCLIIGESAKTVVAGNVRRSAGMRQSGSKDKAFASSKDNLWQQDETGSWRIDPKRDALRMSNHTRVFHQKPTLEECIEAVRKQYYSGEGAIQWAGEAVARANADILKTPQLKKEFLQAYQDGWAGNFIRKLSDLSLEEVEHRISRCGLNPCGK